MKKEEITKTLIQYFEVEQSLYNFNKDEFLSIFNKKQKDYIVNKYKKRVTFFYGGRRSGKTRGNLGAMVYTDKFVFPEIHGRIVYASQTADKAKDLCWGPMQVWNKELKLGWVFREKDNKIITRSNDIVMRGLKDIASAEKDRGEPIKLAIIDEPQSIKERILQYYDYNILEGGMRDFGEYARILYTGNPPHYLNEFLEREMNNPENKYIHTTMFDNPKYSRKSNIDYLMSIIKRRGLIMEEDENGNRSVFTVSDPAYRREFLGERVQDEHLTIFHVNDYNFYDHLPEEDEYEKVMGIDVGHKDADAIVVIYYSRNTGKIYLHHEEEKSKQNIFELAERIVEVDKIHETSMKRIDEGGLGQKISHELQSRYNIYLQPADKQNKMTYVEILKAEIDRGNFLFQRGSELAKEMNQIIYSDDKSKIDDKRGYHSDLLDATLYSFRYIYNYILNNKVDKKKTFAEERIAKILKNQRKKDMQEQELYDNFNDDDY